MLSEWFTMLPVEICLKILLLHPEIYKMVKGDFL